MTTQTRPEDFGTIDCGDGITIEKPGELYQVYKASVWQGAATSLWNATKLVEKVRTKPIFPSPASNDRQATIK